MHANAEMAIAQISIYCERGRITLQTFCVKQLRSQTSIITKLLYIN